MSAESNTVTVTTEFQLPEKTAFLITKRARYKVLEGGRDAVKSWSAARALLFIGVHLAREWWGEPMRCLCARELWTSIEESIHQLLRDQIARLGYEMYYDVTKDHIVGRRGTSAEGALFSFAGLRYNVSELKSYEGYNIALVEEARNVGRNSWDVLENTIRKPGSEIWAVLNPELETDETYQRLVAHPPENAIVAHLTWRDNPWPSAVLADSRKRMRTERPADYDCIWEGHPRSTLENAIFAEEMRKALAEKRITNVPYDPSHAVHTFWDLGWGNHTSIWCGQKVGLEWRMLKFLEDSNRLLPHYIAELNKLPYIWGTDFLPHDGGSGHVTGDSPKKQLEALGRSVVVLPREDVTTSINAARAVFPFVYFDSAGCAQGVQCLRHYQWSKNTDGVVTKREPLHDEWSDGADAFRTFAAAKNKPLGGRGAVRAARRSGYVPSNEGAPGGEHRWLGG